MPTGTPACTQLAKNPRRFLLPCSTAISTAPPHSPPTPKPWTMRMVISSPGRPQSDLRIAGQHSDQERGHAHHGQRGHQHRLASYAISEVPEDDAADRSREKSRPRRWRRLSGCLPVPRTREKRRAETPGRRRCRTGSSRTTRWWYRRNWRARRAGPVSGRRWWARVRASDMGRLFDNADR